MSIFPEPLWTAEQIAERVDALAGEIIATHPGPWVVLSILNGSLIFTADVLRALSRRGVRVASDTLVLSSYGVGTTSTGRVRLIQESTISVLGQSVLLLDDIVETGQTLAYASAYMYRAGAERVTTATLVKKKIPGKRALEPDFFGFSCSDVFVVGYGMDHAHRWRELPYIGVLPPVDGQGRAP